MRVSDMFPSKYIKADDLQGRSHNVLIDRVVQEEIKNDDNVEQKFIVYFRNREKGLVLNQTNAYSIAQLHTEDTTNWIGKPVELYPAMTTLRGRSVPCIRVRMCSVANVTTPAPATAPPINDPAMQGPHNGNDMNDDIPF